MDILGVDVSATDLRGAAEAVEGWIARREPNYVCKTGAHGIMESRCSKRLRDIHNQAGMVTPDGMPLVWVGRLLGRKHMRRVYGPDLMRCLTEVSARRGYRQFYYGGVPRPRRVRHALPAVPPADAAGRLASGRDDQRRAF